MLFVRWPAFVPSQVHLFFTQPQLIDLSRHSTTWQLLLLFSWLRRGWFLFWKTITKSNPRSFQPKAFPPQRYFIFSATAFNLLFSALAGIADKNKLCVFRLCFSRASQPMKSINLLKVLLKRSLESLLKTSFAVEQNQVPEQFLFTKKIRLRKLFIIQH